MENAKLGVLTVPIFSGILFPSMATITEINADIFDVFEASTSTTAIVHCCNCFCSMGAGLAKSIRDRYIQAYDADLSTKSGDTNKLGTVSFAPIGDNKVIFNLYGQFRFGRDKRYVNYEALYTGFEKVRDACSAAGVDTILIPHHMACSLAGGDWRIVETMIRVAFESFEGSVTICKLEKSIRNKSTKTTMERELDL